MQIVDLKYHPKQRHYSGHAQSTRGRRYFFGLDARLRVVWVDRQLLAPWNKLWLHLRPRQVPSLAKAARKAVQS